MPGDCGLIYVPPKGFCPIDVIELTTDDEVELGDTGTVINFTVITPVQYPGQTETEPFARVSIVLDGTDGMLSSRRCSTRPISDVRVGMRVAAVWARRRSATPKTSRPAAGAAPTAASTAGCPPVSRTAT